MFKKILSFFVCVAMCISVDAGPPSGRTGGGSFRAPSSSPKPSMPSSRSSPSTFKPSTPAPKPSVPAAPRSQPSTFKPSTQQTTVVNKPVTKTTVDNKVNKMVKVGNTTMPKAQAVNDFKTKYASSYSSKYTAEPVSRPSHIPNAYVSGGNTYNISYNRGYGGYGYYGPSGAWIMYDAMHDAAMMSILMSRHNYSDVVYTQPINGGYVNDGVVVPQQSVVVYRSNFWGGIFCFTLVLMFIIVACVILVKANE